MARITDDSPLRNEGCLRTHEEIAEIMTARGYPMCRGRVWQLERSALKKIAVHDAIREVAAELGFPLPAQSMP